jgi:outer membrane protein OmpA-like peptidoglycan-associated protein
MHVNLKTLAATSALAITAGLALAATLPERAHAWDFHQWWQGPTEFRHYLARRYTMLSTGEQQDYDIKDSTYLSAAAVNALDGGVIAPHPLEGVMIVSSRPGELENARAFLINVAQNGAVDKMPRAYANALSAFDCRTEQQQSEPNASHNTQQCRRIYMRNAERLAPLATHGETHAQYENLRTLHSVYFAWDHYNLTPQAKQKLDAAHDMLVDTRNGKLIISGYADSSGNAAYNQRLSEKRAETVANYLNLPAERFEIRVQAFGERYLHVPTGDGVRMPQNRVVDISVNADKYRSWHSDDNGSQQ